MSDFQTGHFIVASEESKRLQSVIENYGAMIWIHKPFIF